MPWGGGGRWERPPQIRHWLRTAAGTCRMAPCSPQDPPLFLIHYTSHSIKKRESIPVGCLPFAAVAICCGVCLERCLSCGGCLSWGCLSWGCLPGGGCLPREGGSVLGSVCLGCICLEGGCLPGGVYPSMYWGRPPCEQND